MKTIKELRQEGTKVKIEHYRYNQRGKLVPYSRKTKGLISQKGGITIATVTNGDGEFAKGVAVCSKEDQFSYGDGANIALGRAMRDLLS